MRTNSWLLILALSLIACRGSSQQAPHEEASTGNSPVEPPPTHHFETSLDPGGCRLEHVAVEPGTSQFQVDGLSPDGSTLAVGWERKEERGTYLLDLETGERADLPGLDSGAVFSPSGRTLVNSIYLAPEPGGNGKTDIVEYDRATGEITPIAPHPDWDWLASYSSDGETVLFNSYRTGASDLYTYDRATGELTRRTDDPRYEAYGQYSPDDTRILFHRQIEDGNYDVFVLETESGEIIQLTDDKTEESYASWLPNGKAIVFASDRSQTPGKTDLYLMDSSGAELRQLTDHPAKDAFPFFSPDGRYLYFNSDREPAGIYRIAFDQGLKCVG